MSSPGEDFLEDRLKKKIHRDRVFQEIVITESTYVEQLQSVIEIYVQPLRQENILKPDEITAIFSVLELIVDVNKELLTQLKDKLEQWSDEQTIGDIFTKLGPFLKMYSQYCRNYHKSIDTLIAVRLKNSFINFERQHRLPLINLESYLILPVQRIPRYSLLIEDFLLHTWADHRDFENLCEAQKMIKSIADYVNASMHTSDIVHRVYEIDLLLGGECKDLIQPHRRWVTEGDVIRLNSSLGIMYTKPLRLYLFNDSLVVSQKMLTNYRFLEKIPLLDFFAIPAEFHGAKHVFQICLKGNNYFCMCKNERERWIWITQIAQATDNEIKLRHNARGTGYLDQRLRLAEELGIDLTLQNELQNRHLSITDETESQQSFDISEVQDADLGAAEMAKLQQAGVFKVVEGEVFQVNILQDYDSESRVDSSPSPSTRPGPSPSGFGFAVSLDELSAQKQRLLARGNAKIGEGGDLVREQSHSNPVPIKKEPSLPKQNADPPKIPEKQPLITPTRTPTRVAPVGSAYTATPYQKVEESRGCSCLLL